VNDEENVSQIVALLKGRIAFHEGQAERYRQSLSSLQLTAAKVEPKRAPEKVAKKRHEWRISPVRSLERRRAILDLFEPEVSLEYRDIKRALRKLGFNQSRPALYAAIRTLVAEGSLASTGRGNWCCTVPAKIRPAKKATFEESMAAAAKPAEPEHVNGHPMTQAVYNVRRQALMEILGDNQPHDTDWIVQQLARQGHSDTYGNIYSALMVLKGHGRVERVGGKWLLPVKKLAQHEHPNPVQG
jgi:Fe2+ or Zn2+ uptake regulation protein